MKPRAGGGPITGPDDTPIFTQTLAKVSSCYIIPAAKARELGIDTGWLKRLNDKPGK